MLENIKAIIFDLDGSLVDSMWIWPAVDAEFMRKYNLTMPNGFLEEIEGKSFTETALFFLETFPTLEKTAEEIKAEWVSMCFEKYTNDVKLKVGAAQFIEHCHQTGLGLGIATSNDRSLVEAVLKSLNLIRVISTICTSCEVNSGKPAPDVYLKAAEGLGILPEHCLVFEDVPMGILAGKNANMKVCAVEDEFSKFQINKKKELADYYIRDYFDIINHTYEVL